MRATVRLADEAIDIWQTKSAAAYRKANVDSTVLRQAADVLLEKADMNRLRGQMCRCVRLGDVPEQSALTRQHIQRQRDLDDSDSNGSDGTT